jgi:hypothetical protein
MDYFSAGSPILKKQMVHAKFSYVTEITIEVSNNQVKNGLIFSFVLSGWSDTFPPRCSSIAPLHPAAGEIPCYAADCWSMVDAIFQSTTAYPRCRGWACYSRLRI